MTTLRRLASSLHPGRSSTVPVLILLAGCLVQTFYGHAHPDQYGHEWGLDDAFISYRYAQNLFEGKGLVFNEGARVEGYSNLLYVLLIAPAFRFTGGMGIFGYATFLNVAFAAMALILWHRRMREQLPLPLAAIGALLLALWPPLWAAASSGMETTLVLLVVVATWSVLSSPQEPRENRTIPILGALLCVSLLLRADGFLLALIVLPYLVLKGRGREAVRILPIVLTIAAAHLLWRYSYYGSLAPNTYLVKISGPLGARLAQGTRQILELSLHGGLLPYVLAALLAAAHVAIRAWKGGIASLREAPFELALVLVTLAYWLYIGGDQLGDRFLLPLVPMGLALLMRQISRDWKSSGATLVVLLLVCLTLAPLVFDGRFHFATSKHDMWVALGRHLRERHPGESLAVDAAGKIPFFSGLRTLDMLGLNEPAIARKQVDFFLPSHNKFDADYVLSKRPDLIATFIDPYDLDMSYGLFRVKYEAAGYRLLYLAHGRRDLGDGSILRVDGLGREEIRQHILEGFFYAVLKRTGRGA